MDRFLRYLTHCRPVLMLLYPLHASVIAIESPSREDDKQIPIWYSLKLLLAAWLVLPQFMGAAFIYERFVRKHVRKITGGKDYHLSRPESLPGVKGKNKFVQFETPN
ncbi:hypothetical protein SADUNF_Sadunf19G0086400 [Salix dunnii]|uniref:HVA22-like protein n=1 Tax=Salix dunnii TaxID=1413687 RepID=A0A835J1X9_9ROSI|nr:hypothetical protein SADUNF_Sadunf19G0086400 [Salix dunnii]